MLDELPTEIIHHIASHLPTASSIINLSLTNQTLHLQISGDDYATFRAFVQRRFPSIRTPPYWKDAACILTTRSRAWDRRAFIAKALEPPADRQNPLYYERARGPSIGYSPVIDSYETWQGSRWTDRHEVLVWGAAGRLIMRINESNSTTWHVHKVRNDQLPQNDVLNVRLLRGSQRKAQNKEEVIIRRASGEITKLELRRSCHEFHESTHFNTMGLDAECIDVSHASKPLLAVCSPGAVQIFDGTADEQHNKPISTLNVENSHEYKHRSRCAKFLSEERLAVAVQFVDGRNVAPINIYHVMPDGSSASPELCFPSSNGHASERTRNRTNANAVVPLDDVASLIGRPGQVFLSGWSDGIVRLYDVRAPHRASLDFQDGVDDGQIISLLPVGHERFLAGSLQNACLKTFDFRMPGAKVYSYIDAGPRQRLVSASTDGTSPAAVNQSRSKGPVDEAISRELNIFLAIRVQCPMRLWQPLPKQQLTNLPRYRGAVYSLSAPSPTSPTVYAGVENHVIQLDFASTDDVQKGRQNLSTFGVDPGRKTQEQILNLSCYERPRPGRESTDTVLLRNQSNWNRSRPEEGLTEDGWDERWRLATWDRRNGAWRRDNLAV